jgi:hypothetical protein
VIVLAESRSYNADHINRVPSSVLRLHGVQLGGAFATPSHWLPFAHLQYLSLTSWNRVSLEQVEQFVTAKFSGVHPDIMALRSFIKSSKCKL